MPNWKTHLEISNRINKSYGFEGIDYKIFLFGSILPDVNNSHIVEDISTKLGHKITHCFEESLPSYLVFYKKYKEQIESRNPLFVGYVTHLYADYTWNGDFYTNIKKRNYPETDRTTLREMKWSDFGVFNNKYEAHYIDISSDEEIEILYNECKKISEVDITKEDVKKVIEFLKKQSFHNANLQFYTIEELEELLEKTFVSLTQKEN